MRNHWWGSRWGKDTYPNLSIPLPRHRLQGVVGVLGLIFINLKNLPHSMNASGTSSVGCMAVTNARAPSIPLLVGFNLLGSEKGALFPLSFGDRGLGLSYCSRRKKRGETRIQISITNFAKVKGDDQL
ncbi:MAG: hypothetical protein CM15mP49_35300 [Actinomycetota bacterium]|nr:MAG: hypothetical protein CM15mP49_35300 [Actinomycetota bacterium]